MSNSRALVDKWKKNQKHKTFTFPTSVRLRPDVDAMLQEISERFNHLTQTQIINDCLFDALSNVRAGLSESREVV